MTDQLQQITEQELQEWYTHPLDMKHNDILPTRGDKSKMTNQTPIAALIAAIEVDDWPENTVAVRAKEALTDLKRLAQIEAENARMQEEGCHE